MNINRHNYEEFFLLYVDKELDEAQQIALEEFVKQNPDLRKELDMLKQSLLGHDIVRFEGKNILYKKEAGISMANYQEYFLLSIDNELSPEEMLEVQRFVLNHPQLQDEFTLLKQTISEPEIIQFPQKEALYRTEEKRRVIPFTLMKLAAAAAFAGLVAALWFFTQNNNAPLSKNNLAANGQQFNKSKRSAVAESFKAVIDQPVAGINEEHRNKKTLPPEKKKTVFKPAAKNDIAVANTTSAPKQNTKKELKEKNPAIVQAPKQLEEKSPAPTAEPAKNSTRSSSKPISENAANTSFAANQNVETGKPFVKEALYNEITNDDENRSIFIGATEINKNKLKGFLKRAAVLLDKKLSKSETERTVQIASFEIKSK